LNLLIESHYLPSIPYFAAISNAKTIILERHEHYVKQSYRNRCHILTSQGIDRLVVPLTSKHNKATITELKPDYSQKWVTTHWRAIESAYRNAPFFDYYADDLRDLIFKNHHFLYDLNLEFLTICLKWLKFDMQIRETVAYEKVPSVEFYDLRNAIHAKKPELIKSWFQSVTYPQVFGNKFVEGLSILDLIFCEGPNARAIVMQSAAMNKSH
jgi:hypothetical protein